MRTIISLKKIISDTFICIPFIDIISGFLMKQMGINGFSLVIRLLFLALYMLYIGKYLLNKRNVWVFVFAGYAIFQTIILNLANDVALFYAVSVIIKYIYFFCVLLIFDRTDHVHLEKYKKIFCSVYPMAIIIPQLLGMNYSTYTDTTEGIGQLGWMYSVNVFSFVMIICFYYSTEYVINKMNITNVLRFVYTAVALLLIGSKSVYLYCVFVVMYFVLSGLNGTSARKLFKTLAWIIVVLCAFFCMLSLYREQISGLIGRWIYFYNKRGASGINGILNFLTSYRWERIELYGEIFISNPFNILFGLGYAFFSSHVTVEMDVFTLLYAFGLVGTLLYLKAFFSAYDSIKRIKNISFVVFIAFTYLFFGGHVLSDAVANTVLALVLTLDKKSR